MAWGKFVAALREACGSGLQRERALMNQTVGRVIPLACMVAKTAFPHRPVYGAQWRAHQKAMR